MFGSGQFSVAIRITTVVVPSAVYFLIIGLLNSRRRPQLLTGRRDFALLMAAICPAFLLSLGSLAGSAPAMIALVAGGAVAVLFLAPKTPTWVIYNISHQAGCSAACRALRDIGIDARPGARGIEVVDSGVFVEVGGFSLLRNVSIRLRGADRAFSRRFGAALAQVLSEMPVPTTPMASSFLMIATAMLVAPVALIVQQVPEIVRILTDLLR